MGKNGYRKPRPSIARHWWLDLDCCWFCKNRNNCNGCKVMKEIKAYEKEKRDRQEKQKIKQFVREYE